MLEVRLRHRFAGFTLDVSFDGPDHGITALFGPSGCGKSTVVNAIAGLLRGHEGRIALDGTVLFDSARGINLPLRARRIGYVFQDARLFPHMRVRANLLYGFRRAPKENRRIAVDQVIDLLGISTLLDRYPAGLSGGERQRVGLGRALLAQPRLLLMDEPLAALDPERKADILPYIERLRDDLGLPVVYVSHAIEEVARLADMLVLMDAGRAVAIGPVVDVMANLDLFEHVDEFEGGAVLPVQVLGHDETYQLTRLGFAGGELVVPRVNCPLGRNIRARIRARDVTLALSKPEAISALNVLPALISGVRREEGAYAEVQVMMAETPLVVRLTRQSVDRLGLQPGQSVFAIVKSVAIDRRSLSMAG
jgi:molybdenum ABC transporter, ATP-binding protein